ncbi:hypothetical protein AWE51_23030 [Aquimarina aggregata]|uniref:Peptidase E n=1 Tax=Aquimarina aggregata TaxID=1642818 RepID=A0A163BDH7_9FLAO|nr:DUF6702 family protein [Aquimarina aggregata]KZS41281.1 hypothetical protein AWE51_23030 [Aquimarina aggregata]
MKKTILFFLILGSITLSSYTVHKFYVSVTQIEHNKEQQTLQIISRVFIDDIEDLLKIRYDESLTIDTTKDDPKLDEYLKKYLDQKIKIKVNDKDIAFNFLGKEYEDDLMICYLEVQNISSLEEINISNEVLMDVFEEQQNIVHVKKENQRKSLILEKGKSEGLLNFSE